MLLFNGHSTIDLNCTMIENMFINNFMPGADGNHIKVYIYAFSLAQNPEDASRSTNAGIGKTLGLTIQEVLKAWDYWESKRLIKKHFKDDTDFDIEFISIRQLYIEGIKSGSGQRQPEITTDSFIQQNESPSIASMFHDCEDLIMKEIQYRQRKDILELIEEFGIQPELIVKAFEYSSKTRNISDSKYAIGIARAWAGKGFKTKLDIDGYIQEEYVKETFFKKLYKAIGISGRAVAKGDKDIMMKWIDEYRLPMDFIENVINDAVSKTTNPNFKYFDTYITTLKSDGIEDIYTYEQYIISKKRTNESKSTPTKQPQPQTPKPNRFNDIATNTRKYSNEELEKILLSNKGRK